MNLNLSIFLVNFATVGRVSGFTRLFIGVLKFTNVGSGVDVLFKLADFGSLCCSWLCTIGESCVAGTCYDGVFSSANRSINSTLNFCWFVKLEVFVTSCSIYKNEVDFWLADFEPEPNQLIPDLCVYFESVDFVQLFRS